MKRATAYLLALTMLFAFMLSACGDTTMNKDNITKPVPTQKPAATDTLPDMEEMMPDPDDGVVEDTDGIITDDDVAGVEGADTNADAARNRVQTRVHVGKNRMDTGTGISSVKQAKL